MGVDFMKAYFLWLILLLTICGVIYYGLAKIAVIGVLVIVGIFLVIFFGIGVQELIRYFRKENKESPKKYGPGHELTSNCPICKGVCVILRAPVVDHDYTSTCPICKGPCRSFTRNPNVPVALTKQEINAASNLKWNEQARRWDREEPYSGVYSVPSQKEIDRASRVIHGKFNNGSTFKTQ
jgi:hypothetical protein